MADTLVTHVRGKTYVQEIPESAEGGNVKAAHGLVGKLWVGGSCFDTSERMDGSITMAGDKTNCTTRPWCRRIPKAASALASSKAASSRLSRASFELIREQCGGGKGEQAKALTIALRVDGSMPALSACTAWCG